MRHLAPDAMRYGACTVLTRLVVLLALVLATAFLSHGVAASDWSARDYARFRLLAETTATDGKSEVLIGLEVELLDGWVFSSENPGEFGVAPVFDWSASRNLAQATLHWPAPEQVIYSNEPPVALLGYRKALLLPIVLTAETLDRNVEIRLALDYALCHDICIVDTVHLGLVLASGIGEATPQGPQLRQALAAAQTP